MRFEGKVSNRNETTKLKFVDVADLNALKQYRILKFSCFSCSGTKNLFLVALTFFLHQ